MNVADMRDIGCMKISSVASRGKKRDFIDLHTITREFPLSQMLTLFDRKYFETPYNRMHIPKSLVYFSDAESDPMPDMLVQLTWDTVKQYFESEVPRLL